ncbi:IATP domain containing protein [Asbolus verrucosus]|uniref:IATP domain containing protein n=1 Tax=Asbolus verrucosus TaxID=1661398 RepID=A0A482VD61_ASBVE|nr:IATP domain containing protein [Asbolus verrucosus]
MLCRLQLLTQHRFSVYLFFCRYGGGTGGSGTVKNPDGIFSDREAAMENRYFRQKQKEDLERLRIELKERKKRKKMQSEKVKEGELEDDVDGDQRQ